MNHKIITALSVLELPEKASLRQIKEQYKKLIHRWHPDKCTEEKKLCNEKTALLIESYKLLMEACENYPIPFDQAETETQEEFWARHFGDDPFWGNPHENK